MNRAVQLLIVGAGPAGGYAAWKAAKAGLDVLLVERDEEVGARLSCGEGTSYEGLHNFLKPQDEFISATIDRVACLTTDYSFSHTADRTIGYILDRPRLERSLVDRAMAAGAQLMTSAVVRSVKPNIRGEGQAEVEIEIAGQAKIIRADYVISADGVESLIGRMAGLPTTLTLSQTESALQYRVSGIEIDPRQIEFYLGERYSPDGYLWVFPKSDRSANIGLGFNPASTTPTHLKQILDQFLVEKFPKFKIDFVSCGLVPKFSGFDLLGKDNLLLVGDAARLIDSVSGAGIARAFHSGQLAVEAISETIAANNNFSFLQSTYRRQIESQMGRELKFFKHLYPVIRKFTDDDWTTVVQKLDRYLQKKNAGSVDPAVMIKSIFSSAPSLLKLARHLF